MGHCIKIYIQGIYIYIYICGTCIKYKLACICYNCMSTNSPPYLSDLLTVYIAARQRRSSSDNSVLRRPSVRTVSYIVKGLSHIPPLLLGTLFLSRSALLIMSLLSDPELKLTFSVFPRKQYLGRQSRYRTFSSIIWALSDPPRQEY